MRISSRCRSMAFALACLAGSASASDLMPLQVDRAFAFDPKEGPNLSAITCEPPGKPERRCFAVDDELRLVQSATFLHGTTPASDVTPAPEATPAPDATLMPDRLVVGDTLDLFASANPPILGSPTQNPCPNELEPGEFDGEAIAYRESGGLATFLVAGSHGCSRKKAEFRPEIFVLARLTIAANGDIPIERTHRLADVLKDACKVGAHFGKKLNESEKGLNLEGIAVDGGTLIVGLRAPVPGDKAFLVSVAIDALFAPGEAPFEGESVVDEISLGPNTGIRDLSRLPDGRLLVLSGPSEEQLPAAYRILAVNADRTLTELARLPDVTHKDQPSPEGIEVIAASDDSVTLMVISDGALNGGPVVVKAALPGAALAGPGLTRVPCPA